jgi:hypothetical protein
VTVIAGLVIAAAVTIGILLLYLLQLDSVRSTVDQQLRTYVSQIAQASPTGSWTTPLPASPLASAAQAQVIAADGAVVAATRGLSGVPATFTLPADSATPVRLKGALTVSSPTTSGPSRSDTPSTAGRCSSSRPPPPAFSVTSTPRSPAS